MVDIEIEKGNKLYFKGNKYNIVVSGFLSAHSGKIPYLNQKFDLSFAEMRVNSDAGIPIVSGEAAIVIDGLEIKLSYTGPVDKFKPTLRAPSRPELSEEELLKIIKYNTTNNLSILDRKIENTDEYGTLKLIDHDLSSYIQKPLEERLFKPFNLFFDVNAPLIENYVKSGIGDTGINPLLNASLSVGKYLSKDLYLEYRGKVVNTNEIDNQTHQYKTGWKQEVEAIYNLKRNTSLRYKYSPALEKDKDSEHFFMLEKKIRF